VTFSLGSQENPDRIVRQKLSDQILERLREMIRKGDLKPGDTLPSERKLMDRFGVGRPAIREALQSLHQTGLIAITQGERTRVTAINPATFFEQNSDIARILLNVSPSNLQHLKEARQMFELGMVRLAAEQASVQDVTELRSLVALQKSRLGGDPMPFIQADIQFHARIAAIAGNPIISAASNAILHWLFEYHTALLHWSGFEHVTLAEHADIVDQIEAKSPDRAVEVMRDHLNRSRDFISN
jgi:GntR family transcriptional regulator, sialic acid-inducible nan operon repressor